MTIHNKKKTETVRSTIATIKEWEHGPTGTSKALYEKIQYKDARYEKRVEINNKRLELAKAYREEEANNYFRSIAPLTKLFVAN